MVEAARKRLYGTLCDSNDDAEDVVQDAALKAVKYRHSFDRNKGNIEAWFRTIVVRCAMNRLSESAAPKGTSEWRQSHSGAICVRESDLPETPTDHTEREGELCESAEDTAIHRAESDIVYQRIGEVLNSLTKSDQRLLIERYVTETPVEEMRQRYGLTDAQFRSRMHEARRAARRAAVAIGYDTGIFQFTE
jgi:RNA polymerase sigma factor (sigma-70 family)